LTHTRAHANALALFALLLLAAMSAPAQDVAAGERPEPAQTVLLNVTVTDGKGHTVAGVKREDFHAQLVLGFTPPQSMKGDAPHKIEVKVVSRPGGGKLKAFTRPEITLAVHNGAEWQKR